ncbi:carbonic anhydrase [Frigoriglobus tundricola]|uniref:carbonic anhydrase n=1 Tax=Frigoriglobus tundricola TaxID=2774151 RepID=A0A6M5YT10_9BACT|nr:carbonic anhydrase [Frigoriglobus tundricola]QJW96540.1 Carbonic anhydrase, beta class [Frigoriglobus tundricola]
MCDQNHVHTALCAGPLTAAARQRPVGAAAHVRAERGSDPWEPTPDDLSPDEALDLLYAGNARFATGNPAAPNRDLERLKEVAPAQRPFAAVLGCADSRVPVEIVFDRGCGDLFVTRIAGNVTTPECISSLEFGTHVLGAKVLYVLGHTHCGAITAAVRGEPVPGQISVLFQHLRPAVRAAQGDVALAVLENVKAQAAVLSEASPVIAQLIRDGKLKVAGGVYDISTGRVTPVEI